MQPICACSPWRLNQQNKNEGLRSQALPALFGNACWICPTASPRTTESDSAFPARSGLKIKPTRVLAAPLLPPPLGETGQVVLRPAHWNVSIDDLLANMPDSVPSHQALPVHVDAKRARMDGESAAERFSDPPHVWEGRVVDLLREILPARRA